jgi:uracil-DNA glycosylase family 4
LDKVPGVNKVKGLSRIEGRRIMAWAQNPGCQENEKKLELVGPSGQLLWEELEKEGITRADCDVQNVVRCWTIDKTGAEHTPTKRELKCCSIYNDDALRRNRNQAQVHLILGKMAGTQLLGRSYRKDKPVQWHEPWNAYAVLADHPSYVLRSGGRKSGWPYYSFRDRMKATKAVLNHPGRWGYVMVQDYAAAMTEKEVDRVAASIEKEAAAGRRVSVDVEDGDVDGKRAMLMVGFGWGRYAGRDWNSWKGASRSIILFHPEAKLPTKRIDYALRRIDQVLGDVSIRKAMHHGSYDVTAIKDLLGIRVRGYDFDTQYAAYLRYPHLRTYSLESLARFFFQEFADYKDMVAEWSGNFANVPLDRLVRYNCADADLTKRAEVWAASHVNQALLEVYIRVAFVLDRMEKTGPILDTETADRVAAIIPDRLREIERSLTRISGRADFNPGSPAQVAWLLFDKLGLPEVDGRSTEQDALENMAQRSGSKAPRMVAEHRKLSKILSTYVAGYRKSAEIHGGELRTVWWLTGAVTGRLRSGKGDAAEREGIVNMQNLHGNPVLQNLLVSDRNWRRALDGK